MLNELGLSVQIFDREICEITRKKTWVDDRAEANLCTFTILNSSEAPRSLFTILRLEGVINGIFFNQGHVCCAGSRLYVQEGVAEKVIQKLKRRMNSLILGDPLDKNTDMGAINSPQQLERVQALVQQGCDQGATMWQSDQGLAPYVHLV